jgi:hypothetical protein
MALNYIEIARKLNECDANLTALFKDENPDNTILQHIQAIKDYYHLSYSKAEEKQTIEAILINYADYVSYLEKVKQGRIGKSYEEASLIYKNAQEFIIHASDSRYLNVIKYDILKAGEILFWASTAVTLYASIYLLVLPMLMLQPVLGAAMLLTLGGLLIKSAVSCIYCFTEFKSLERHMKESENEINLLNFFIPKKVNPEPVPQELPSTHIPIN